MNCGINRIAVLGAGVMGSQIAGQAAGCGIPVVLLDTDRSLVEKGLDNLVRARPAAIYDRSDLKMISAGSFKDDLTKICGCDWVVEAVIENLEIKEKLYSEVEKLIGETTIISSNTSGLLWRDLVAGRSGLFKHNFIITHFFNPVRYMRLVEIVKGPETGQGTVQRIAGFLNDVMGKVVIHAKDSPGFIANRIGVFDVISVMDRTFKDGWPIEAVDQVLGRPVARPKSATFRTLDIVGIDTFCLVARNLGYKLPATVEEMLKRGWIGEKSGQGFYKKDGEILVLDYKTMEYRPQQKISAPSLDLVKDVQDPAERLKMIALADDEAGRIAWPIISGTIEYAADVVGEIAYNPEDLDKAMRFGFSWEMGPFEQLDVLKGKFSGLAGRFASYRPRKIERPVIERNAGADITDLGDGVIACEFHTKMNTIDGEIVEMLNRAMDRAEKDGAGLVISNDGENFSAGANLMMIFLAATNAQWDEIDRMVVAFQRVNQRIRFCKRPVVVAPFGLSLGGGCEMVLASRNVRAAMETYIGLVEAGVGLIPAGGGCKNMLLRMEERYKDAFDPKNSVYFAANDGGPFPKVKDAFQTIGLAKVAASAKDAVGIGYLSKRDKISITREGLMASAKADVIEASKGFVPAEERVDILLPGRGGMMAIMNNIRAELIKGNITEHDAVIGEKLAYVLTGGDCATEHRATEDHILELEREAFLSLCGMEKTVARIQNMLKTGKPLRN